MDQFYGVVPPRSKADTERWLRDVDNYRRKAIMKKIKKKKRFILPRATGPESEAQRMMILCKRARAYRRDRDTENDGANEKDEMDVDMFLLGQHADLLNDLSYVGDDATKLFTSSQKVARLKADLHIRPETPTPNSKKTQYAKK